LLNASFLLSSCTSQTPQPVQTYLLLYRFDKSAFIEYSADLQPLREIPFGIPLDCGLNNIFAAPIGSTLLLELDCPNGQTVLFFDTSTDASTQPVTDSDARFLAWTSDGKAAYLKVDSFGNPHVIRMYPDGVYDTLAIDGFTYDLAAKPDSRDFTFTFSHGLGYGSEIHLAKHDGRITQLLYSDPYNYISFAHFSPERDQIAFLKIPDSQTPFTVGELWVMDADGSNPRKLADADAGHGFAANWSPDGTQIAFVKRENPEDESANHLSEALVSNIYVVEINTGALTQITHFKNGHAETPYWSPEGNTLAFSAVIDGRMTVSIAEMSSGEVKFLETEPACCPAWMRK
jgi:Tol biopolymer transport system component